MLTSDDGTDETAGVDGFMLEIVATMTEELGKRPSVTEVVDVVMQSLPFGDYRLNLRLFPREAIAIGEDDNPIERRGSRVGELNDAAFVFAAQMISMQLQSRAGRERKVSADDLLSDLVDAISRVPECLLEQPPTKLRRIRIVGPPARKNSNIGDLVAIPAAGGGYHLALVVARNRFGTAFGFFRGRHEVPRLRQGATEVNPHPIYSDEQSILKGPWRIVGHYHPLLSLFPNDPEIYHRMGIAETADGTIREVSDHEAMQV